MSWHILICIIVVHLTHLQYKSWTKPDVNLIFIIYNFSPDNVLCKLWSIKIYQSSLVCSYWSYYSGHCVHSLIGWGIGHSELLPIPVVLVLHAIKLQLHIKYLAPTSVHSLFMPARNGWLQSSSGLLARKWMDVKLVPYFLVQDRKVLMPQRQPSRPYNWTVQHHMYFIYNT